MLRRLVLCLSFIGAAGVASAQPVYTPPGGSGLTPGTSTVTGATNCLLYADASSTLACNSWLAGVDAGAGTPTITFTKTMSGTSATSNFFNLTGTLPASMSTNAFAFVNKVTGRNTSVNQIGMLSSLVPGTATTTVQFAFVGILEGAASTASTSFTQGGIYGVATGASSGAGSNTYGVVGSLKQPGSDARGAGGLFIVHNGTAPTSSGMGTALPNIPAQAALAASNMTTTKNILELYDNTTVKVTTLDGGHTALYNMSLTAGTMAVETDSQLRTTTSSFTWTNAQVVALGAVTAGDITVATLPAKTQVLDAAVVITGAAVGPTTVTVACGRTSATYIDYIVASDAKAAANTVYGDAAAERGTNLTGYDLPSYTGTTAVVCHFVSTGANLDTVTGSTGRVILTTRLMP